MKGKIIRGIGGFYYIHVPETQKVYECRAKGIFRKDNIKPLPGDWVEMAVLDEDKLLGNIEQILPRKNALIRPAVANIDQALVIFAAASPKPSLNLLDRFLLRMELQAIPCIICFNKQDLADSESLQKLEEAYQGSGYPVLFVSAKQNRGLDQIRALMAGKTTTVAGPSGVGKSSLINLLQNQMEMETGEISEKIERGRHTTRHTELLWAGDDTYILDTPGFSSIAIEDLEKEELEEYFPEMRQRTGSCRFVGCAHMSEPDCAVKEAVEEGEISRSRYENYRMFYEELKSKRKY